MITHVLQSNILAQGAGAALNALFKEYGDKPFLFLSSGGSSLAILDFIDPSLFTKNSMIAVLDERYSTDPSINNLAQIEKTSFYEKVKKNGCAIIDTKPKEKESADMLAKRFETEIIDWMHQNKNGSIIASVGIGPDAHTSGIMPYPENKEFFEKTFDDQNHLVVAYDAVGKNPHRERVTTTLTFLRKINYTVIFVSGESKKIALQKLVSRDGNLAESPCRIWRELKNVQLFTDQNISI